jgi:hypothetical protein
MINSRISKGIFVITPSKLQSIAEDHLHSRAFSNSHYISVFLLSLSFDQISLVAFLIIVDFFCLNFDLTVIHRDILKNKSVRFVGWLSFYALLDSKS